MKKNLDSLNNQIILNKIFIGTVALFLIIYFLSSKFFNHIISLELFIRYVLIVFSLLGLVPVVKSAFQALREKSITVDLLAVIALVFTLIKGEWVSAAFINLMLASARLFSLFTTRRTENIISHLLKLRPISVKIKFGEYVKEIPLEKIQIDDLVVVESGDRVAIDGKVISGESSIDESTLTGESEPVSKKVGDQVFSSTLCVNGSLVVKTEKVGADTTLEKMIALVGEASRAKTKTEMMANKFSAWYIAITLLGSALVFLITHSSSVVLGVLLVTCADDLAVAIPLGFTVAIAKAAKHGIIVKGSAVMERLRNIKIFVTDKTGTLTRGRAKVVDMIVFEPFSKDELLEASGIASTDSKHPISKTIFEYVTNKSRKKIHAPDEVNESPGSGIRVKHNGHEYLQGKLSFLEESGIRFGDQVLEKIKLEKEKGASLSLVSIDGRVAGVFILEDEIRKFAKEVVNETRELGIEKWVMLTGDNEMVADRVARAIGIDEFHANLKPEEKLQHIKKLKQHYGNVGMAGDGVNDAASLALSDVSFAMGSIGSDASIEAADIAIMHDDLRRIPEAIFLSKEAIKIVKQNYFIWGFSNAVGLVLVFMGVLGPAGASAFNFLTDFFPILNVFRIYRLKINKHTYDTM